MFGPCSPDFVTAKRLVECISVEATNVMSTKRAMAGSHATVTGTTKFSARSEAEAATKLRRIAFELAFTILLIGALVCAALYLGPAIFTKSQKPIGSILIATLLPFGTLVLLSVIERLFSPAGPRKSLKRWFFHLQMNIFWSFVAVFTFGFATMATSAAARYLGFNLGLIDLRFAEGKGILALLGAVLVSLIVGDFVFYWYHRTLHKVPFLWGLHKLHHMDPELDVLTLNRDNWLDTVAAALLIATPAAILFKLDNLDLWELGLLAGFIATVFSTLLTLGHMNVRLQVGKASLFYCSPQVHRIHHSCLPQHFDRNFAFILPLWDVLFGTYYAPAWDEFPPTGVPGEKEIQSFWEGQTFTPREWWKMFRAWRERKTLSNIG